MKTWMFIGLLSAALPFSVRAELANPIRQFNAPANSKYYNAPSANMPMVPMKMWSGSTAAPSHKILPNKIISDKMALTRNADLAGIGPSSTMEKARGTSLSQRQSNFTGRRAASDGRHYPTKQVAERSAPINPREIKANTPAGTEELKQQLNGLQWTTPK